MNDPPINDLDLIYRTILENRALLEAVIRQLDVIARRLTICETHQVLPDGHIDPHHPQGEPRPTA